MATERFVNNGQTTVASDYTASATTLVVADASKLPTLSGSDAYHILLYTAATPVNAEIMLVTAVTSNTLTVIPARESIAGTQISQNHPTGDIVAAAITVEALLLIISQTARYIEEAPTGSINGSNTAFALTQPPLKLNVYLNGLKQRVGGGNDYTLSGSTVTFNSAPQTGDSVFVSYYY